VFDCLGFTDTSTYLLSRRKKTSLEVIGQLEPVAFTECSLKFRLARVKVVGNWCGGLFGQANLHYSLCDTLSLYSCLVPRVSTCDGSALK
jgi:hypothetical protein